MLDFFFKSLFFSLFNIGPYDRQTFKKQGRIFKEGGGEIFLGDHNIDTLYHTVCLPLFHPRINCTQGKRSCWKRKRFMERSVGKKDRLFGGQKRVLKICQVVLLVINCWVTNSVSTSKYFLLRYQVFLYIWKIICIPFIFFLNRKISLNKYV